jgi:Asp-tRNA(Asn)/Glu-tRNA(Gln) amidotransferase A subunit family amidase
MLKVLDVILNVCAVILQWFNRQTFAKINPRVKEALRIREEVNDQTNRQLIKLQDRKIDDLQRDLDNLVGKLDAILHPRKPDPPAK